MMEKAVRLAKRGVGRTSPNPVVGAVIAKRGVVVGQGYHARAGGDHAEILALREAGSQARGADLFVNLEPCNHQGRTPPCTEALIAAGLRRVVIGVVDPNPIVRGAGVSRLSSSGIEVVTGTLKKKCERLNEAYSMFVTCRRPHVILKSAITLDGHTACRNGRARWITGERARLAGHRLRNQVDAVAVGIGTIRMDDPLLNCRSPRWRRDPVRVIFDSGLELCESAKVVEIARTSRSPTWVMTTTDSCQERELRLRSRGVEVLRVRAERGRVSIPAAVKKLAARGIVSVLVEGGPTLAGSFWSENLVDRVIAFVAPRILGDPEALPMIAGGWAADIDAAIDLADVSVRRLGTDIVIDGLVRRGGAG